VQNRRLVINCRKNFQLDSQVNKNGSHSAKSSFATSEIQMIWLLCLLAAIHVFIYDAAFPFFNNFDELVHFDLVVKYSHAVIPRHLETYSDESIPYVALYSSPFYLATGTNDQELVPQPWKLPPQTKDQIVRVDQAAAHWVNYESSQPPLYYAIAGAVWRLAGGLGFSDGQKLYTLHFLNVPIICLLVWLGWFAAKEVFPDNIFPRVAVPTFIAFMPQSAFYSVQNDVLSPLCFGIAFVCLLRFFRAENPGWRLGGVTGLALAATFLTKMTNIPLLAVSIAALAIFIVHLVRAKKLKKALPALSILTASAALPALAWILWCRKNFGDLTGSQPKVLYWGWTNKPFAEWFHHPIFSFHGIWIFWSNFLSEFWQGEMAWHRQPLSLRGVNWFYEFITIALLLVALAKIIRSPRLALQSQNRALWFSFSLCASLIAFLIYISIRFDFHNCVYPSRNFPYLVSGRLALGALIPFMLLFVSGLDNILNRLDLRLKFFVLAALNLIMLIAEFATNGPAFADEYNWFHM
jgi:hypothetical protein